MTLPGPESMLPEVVRTPVTLSSITTPPSEADAGNVTDWFEPASTDGG